MATSRQYWVRVAHAQRATACLPRRAGYTLLELCLVVSLLVVLTALTVPYFTGSLAGARVDASGDMILARMADARSMAMEHGKAFRFGFMPGTGRFYIAADDSPAWQSGGTQQGTIDTEDERAGQLLPDVMFTTSPTALSGTAAGGGSGNWQIGGVFLPDGTAHGGMNPDGTTIDDVTFYFGMTGRAPMGVRLRGLTGTIRLFDPGDNEANQP